jgi:hypothetical protein
VKEALQFLIEINKEIAEKELVGKEIIKEELVLET